ncbi:MAG: SLBB domain-containing protein [Candidatus Binatus sp.]|uniref:SLBB domain-containing protein n=1 Tax=Candidatus Binatus sp. TaxID=2811406 RepID=UPI002728597B|nr:SLBB domain-containing protein [Candidatus Binatus sp.]MDO8432769.1 SLBB domain-containing protein [Candidatus Binatus sp.]
MNGKLKLNLFPTVLLVVAIASLPAPARAQMSSGSSGGASSGVGSGGGPGYGAPTGGYAAPSGGPGYGSPNAGMPGTTGGPMMSGAPNGGMPGNSGPVGPPSSNASAQFVAPAAGAGMSGSTSGASILNGTGISPQEAAKMLNTVGPGCQSALANQMGLSCDQIQSIRSQIANGGSLNSSQIESISAKLATNGMSPTDIASVAATLGLTQNQLSMVRGRMNQLQVQPNGQSTQTQMTPGQPSGGSGGVQMQQMTNDSRTMSSIEKSFKQSVTGQVEEFATPENLYQYGYSMFSGQVSTFAPVNNVPVGSDYIVGPGDEFRVLVWGRVNDSWSLQVQRNGQVEIPQVGPLEVGGLTFEQAKKLIEAKTSTMTGVHADVTMGELRTIQVFVVGEVQQPGPYTVSALSRVSNVLAAAGGISKIGSLRKVQVKRHDKLISLVDLYSILMHGDTSADIRLQQDDVIYVPVIGPAFGIAGVVKRPAIYEMAHPTERLADAVALAGGVGAFAYTQRVQVQRVQDHVRRIVLDTPINQLAARNFETIDGDLIKVFPVLPDQKNYVRLIGNVFRPGDFQWNKQMRVTDLVSLGEGTQPHTYFKYALLKRLEGKELYAHYLPLNLGAIIADSNSPQNIALRPFDEVTIYSEDNLRDLPSVSITGQVRMPGSYRLDPRMKVSDLVYLAGGLSDNAYQQQATLARTQVIDGAHTEHTYMEVDLRQALAANSASNPLLQNNDQLFIRTATNWHLPWTVTVGGRVPRPGVYPIREGETLDELLDKCGGFLPDAFPKGLIFTRASVQAIEQRQLDDSRMHLAQDLMQLTLSAPTSSSGGADTKLAAQTATLQHLLAAAQTAQADGRVVIQWNDRSSGRGRRTNVVLQDGDNVTVPLQPLSINVLGQVNSPTSLVPQPGFKVKDYLYRAGGPSNNADMDNLMVVQADGAVVTEEGLKHTGSGSIFPALPLISGGLMNAKLEAGDTIYVPEDVQSFVKLERAKDIATIVAQSAMTLGVVGLLALRL